MMVVQKNGKNSGKSAKMPFFALFPLFWGFESTLHTLWAKGGCSAQALNYVAVPQQQSCKNNQGARGQKVPAGNGQKWRFLHFFTNCWGFRARWGSGIVPICPQWACGVPWGMLPCQRLVGGQPKWQGLGRKLPKMAHKWPFLHPSSPPWLGLVGQWQVLCCLCWEGMPRCHFVCGGTWN